MKNEFINGKRTFPSCKSSVIIYTARVQISRNKYRDKYGRAFDMQEEHSKHLVTRVFPNEIF